MITGKAYLHARGPGYIHDWDLVLDTGNSAITGNAIVWVTRRGDTEATTNRNCRFTDGVIRLEVIKDSRLDFTDGLAEGQHPNQSSSNRRAIIHLQSGLRYPT